MSVVRKTKFIDKTVDSADEWFHRHGFSMVKAGDEPSRVAPWWGYLVKPLCDMRERRLIAEDRQQEWQANHVTSTANASYLVNWKVTHPHKGRCS